MQSRFAISGLLTSSHAPLGAQLTGSISAAGDGALLNLSSLVAVGASIDTVSGLLSEGIAKADLPLDGLMVMFLAGVGESQSGRGESEELGEMHDEAI